MIKMYYRLSDSVIQGLVLDQVKLSPGRKARVAQERSAFEFPVAWIAWTSKSNA